MFKQMTSILSLLALLSACSSDDDTASDAGPAGGAAAGGAAAGGAAAGSVAAGGAAAGGVAAGGSVATPPPADLNANCAVVYDWVCDDTPRCSDPNVDFTNQCNWARDNKCDFCAATLSAFAALQPTCNWMEPVPTAAACQ
jgi:hypothetical protein